MNQIKNNKRFIEVCESVGLISPILNFSSINENNLQIDYDDINSNNFGICKYHEDYLESTGATATVASESSDFIVSFLRFKGVKLRGQFSLAKRKFSTRIANLPFLGKYKNTQKASPLVINDLKIDITNYFNVSADKRKSAIVQFQRKYKRIIPTITTYQNSLLTKMKKLLKSSVSHTDESITSISNSDKALIECRKLSQFYAEMIQWLEIIQKIDTKTETGVSNASIILNNLKTNIDSQTALFENLSQALDQRYKSSNAIKRPVEGEVYKPPLYEDIYIYQSRFANLVQTLAVMDVEFLNKISLLIKQEEKEKIYCVFDAYCLQYVKILKKMLQIASVFENDPNESESIGRNSVNISRIVKDSYSHFQDITEQSDVLTFLKGKLAIPMKEAIKLNKIFASSVVEYEINAGAENRFLSNESLVQQLNKFEHVCSYLDHLESIFETLQKNVKAADKLNYLIQSAKTIQEIVTIESAPLDNFIDQFKLQIRELSLKGAIGFECLLPNSSVYKSIDKCGNNLNSLNKVSNEVAQILVKVHEGPDCVNRLSKLVSCGKAQLADLKKNCMEVKFQCWEIMQRNAEFRSAIANYNERAYEDLLNFSPAGFEISQFFERPNKKILDKFHNFINCGLQGDIDKLNVSIQLKENLLKTLTNLKKISRMSGKRLACSNRIYTVSDLVEAEKKIIINFYMLKSFMLTINKPACLLKSRKQIENLFEKLNKAISTAKSCSKLL